ncbi:MAG TPA: type II 3-dehydroquinate dehydratase [Peptococcaceae bacterium]|jgi:3-dehydroquinate dehydratase-2|nr:type II 3-dehydroquinate dehydratase [Peptococcaceae bacterium]HPZ71979.1 type II 3-dehydroquinate dehydratase [Peptococcaceae bacterium]HQD53617.1 type II 3-dehydroquinate dehydratase [Peptococcaceae bacterium]
MPRVCVIHGPNINLLGKREPEVYGNMTMNELNKQLVEYGKELGMEVDTFQSNHEGDIVDKIQEAEQYDYLIINPAAYSHTSVAIRDAIKAVNKPAMEVHISNIYKRESFRQHSLLSDVVQGQITGLGVPGYRLALEAAAYFLGEEEPDKIE